MVHRWSNSNRRREVLQAWHGEASPERRSVESGQTQYIRGAEKPCLYTCIQRRLRHFLGLLSTCEIQHQAFRGNTTQSGQRNRGQDPTIPIYIRFRELHCSLSSTVQCFCDMITHVRFRQAPNNRLQPYSRTLTLQYSAPAEKRRNFSTITGWFSSTYRFVCSRRCESRTPMAALLRYTRLRYSAFR